MDFKPDFGAGTNALRKFNILTGQEDYFGVFRVLVHSFMQRPLGSYMFSILFRIFDSEFQGLVGSVRFESASLLG